MTDSVAVFPPGFRLADTAGVPYSGAVIRFFDAETTTPKTVYADADLSVTLGTSVTTDSEGYPTSNGTTKTLVYTGTASYKVTAETSAAVSIWSHDNVKGAVEASTGGGSVSATYETPVETKSLDYTILDADQSKVFLANCSSADVTFTLPSAVTVGAGWRCRIDHAGSANQATLESVSSQTIRRGGTSYGTSFSLSYQGEGVTLVSDGGNWVLTEYSTPFLLPSSGVFTIVDRLSAPPGSPADGAVYLLTSSPSGAWSSFAEHDLAQWTGAAWVKVTPPSDIGWLAYVQDEDIYYKFSGSAWAALIGAANEANLGIIQIADQSGVEAASATTLAVTAGRMQYHPGVAKFWAYVTVSGGTPTLVSSHNVTSITDTAVGRLTVTIGTDFSSGSWACTAMVQEAAGTPRVCQVASIAAGTVEVACNGLSSSLADPAAYHIVGYGDQ